MKKFLFKLKFALLRKNIFHRYASLRVSERLQGEDLLEEQERGKQRIVRYAITHIPFYKNFYKEHGFHVEDIGGLNWFERLPIVTKEHLRNHFSEMVAPSQEKNLRVSTTGGSTGVPTKCGYDGRLQEEIYSWRLQAWYGIHPWDHHAYVWRVTRTSRKARFLNALAWWPTRHLKLDASLMTDEAIECFLKKYNRLKPALLQGYVGAMTCLARYIVEHRLPVWSPKLVWVTSAPLPPSDRALLSEVFKAPVCDQYGSCELRWIAQQCPEERGLHVNTEHVFIEFVDEDNLAVHAGEYGKTLVTNLEDTVFPLIRYENGDRGRWLNETCPCGRSLPMIDSVKGRQSESFVLPSGKIINGEYLTTIFDRAPDLVTGFHIIQHKDLSIMVEYIPAKDIPDGRGEICRIRDRLAHDLGDEVPVLFKEVRKLQHDRGKSRFIVKE